MARAKSLYTCTECGGQSSKWQGQCPHCMAWNTLLEGVAETAATHRYNALAVTSKVQSLGEVEAQEVPREPTGIAEFDRVLGGGLVQGAVVLIGGDPGIGKSTLLLQALCHLSRKHHVLYVSGGNRRSKSRRGPRDLRWTPNRYNSWPKSIWKGFSPRWPHKSRKWL